MTVITKIKVFCEFFDDFGLLDTFQERIAPNSLEIGKDKMHTKFSALSVDLNGPSFNVLGSRKLAHEGIKER